MLFPTAEFALFFILVLCALAVIGQHLRTRQWLLLISSYVFYAAWDWRFCVLLLASGIWNFSFGTALLRLRALSNSTKGNATDSDLEQSNGQPIDASNEDAANEKSAEVSLGSSYTFSELIYKLLIGFRQVIRNAIRRIFKSAASIALRCNQLIEQAFDRLLWKKLERFADHPSAARVLIITGVAGNLVTLGFFKYYDFFIENLSSMLSVMNWERDMVYLEVLAPVGISFFTFQGISFLIDSYRGQVHNKPTFVETLLFISFFPQLVAGPILRAAQFLPQLRAPVPKTVDKSLIGFGLVLIIVGLFKKVVIAQTLSDSIVDPVFFDPSVIGSVDLLIGVYAYAIQIYCDFSGYTDIATGVAALMGYRFERNFRLPYSAITLRDFWRRWHITLSSWLRDYLYVSLGGNRKGALITARNVIITMTLGGLWHGAAWKFIAWGALHGGALAIEHLISKHYKRFRLPEHLTSFGQDNIARVLRLGKWVDVLLAKFAGRVYTFHIVCAGWILFRAPDIESASIYFTRIINWEAGDVVYATPYIVMMVVLSVLIQQIVPENNWKNLGNKVKDTSPAVVGAMFGFALGVIAIISPPGISPFIYFQF